LPAHLVQGLAAPLLDYQTMWREGGSLVVAPFSAVFLALLGPSYFALKVAAIAWHGLIVLTWTAIGRLALGRREGLALGLLLACAPPFAARMQLIALVGHPEGNFLSGLALLGLLLVFGETSRRRRQGAAGLLGISVTLGASFTYSAVPAVGLCLLLALRNRDRLVGVGRPLLAGLALGAIPWLCYFVFRVDLEGVWRSSGEGSALAALLGISPGAEIYSSVPFLDRLSDLLRQLPPRSRYLRDRCGGVTGQPSPPLSSQGRVTASGACPSAAPHTHGLLRHLHPELSRDHARRRTFLRA
jgi:hypothetical protein